MTATDRSEWEVISVAENKSGVYYSLNFAHKQGRDAITVKARTDGTYLCLNAECVRTVRPLLTFLDPLSTRAGCVHSRFVRDVDAKRCAALHAADGATRTSAAAVDDTALTSDAPSVDEDDE
jgi:hypothetical protein